MPIIDSRLGIYVKDTKPTRICRWRQCPLVGSDYEGVKLKACARCNFVRYCSKECQKSDWPTHRRGCRVPQFVDIGSWIRAYGWLLKWAATESLQIHTHQSKIHTHCLVVKLLAVERVVGPVPSPFVIMSAHVSETKTVLPDSGSHVNDTRTSERIRDEGGVGQAMVVLQCHMVNGQVICMVERFEIWERKKGVYEHFGGWEGLLKGVANGTIGLADISHQLQLGGDRETFTDVLESMDKLALE